MRILQLVNRFDFGGAENHIRELCNELVALDHQVILATRDGRQRSLLDKQVRFCRVPSWVANVILLQTILIVFLALKHKVQVIHAHQRLPILAACLAGTLLRIPVVATIHGRVKYDLRSFLARALTTRIIFVSKQVLTISRFYESIRHKSVVIPNGIPFPKYAPTIEPFCIGYISRMDERHSLVIRDLILAVEHLKVEYPSIKLVLMGDGKGALELRSLIDAANKRLDSETILFKGFIDNLEQGNTYPELILGVGRVAIEALARHSNVISVNYKRMGGLISPENYAEYAVNNFVNVRGVPPTKDALYHHLKAFFAKRDSHRGMADTITAQVRNDFSINRTTREITNLYASILP